jgi:hypothetical protein
VVWARVRFGLPSRCMAICVVERTTLALGDMHPHCTLYHNTGLRTPAVGCPHRRWARTPASCCIHLCWAAYTRVWLPASWWGCSVHLQWAACGHVLLPDSLLGCPHPQYGLPVSSRICFSPRFATHVVVWLPMPASGCSRRRVARHGGGVLAPDSIC